MMWLVEVDERVIEEFQSEAGVPRARLRNAVEEGLGLTVKSVCGKITRLETEEAVEVDGQLHVPVTKVGVVGQDRPPLEN